MILGIEDIAGGPAIVAFLTWLVLTGLLYLVCFVAAMQVIDEWTGNGLRKIPVMLGAAFPSALLMAVLNYAPLALALLMAGSNYFRVRKLAAKAAEAGHEPLNTALHYGASYAYILLASALTFYFSGTLSAP